MTQGEQGLAFSINGAPARRLPWVDGLTFRNGTSYLTFRRAGDGAAHELRYVPAAGCTSSGGRRPRSGTITSSRPNAMRLSPSLFIAPLIATLGATSMQAQAAPAATPVPGPVVVLVPPAAPADVESIDAIITALYDVISGPAGQPRNWDRMRSLFIPGGRLMPTGARQDARVMRVLEVNDYIAMSGPQLERMGFRERELARRTEHFGHIAHVFSTYEGRSEADGMVIRGINSIQLMNDGTRWWMVSVFWEAETPDNQLPAKYLTTGN